MATPILLPQCGKLQLKVVRGSAFQFLYQKAYTLTRLILYVHVNVVFTHHALQYVHILAIAYLDQQVSTTLLDITFQHRIAILRRPYNMACQTTYRVATMSIVFHGAKVAKFIET